MTRRLGHLAVALLAGSALWGCAAQPTINTDATQRSHDGLYAIDNSIVDQAWVRGDLDLSGYNKIKLESSGIQYRPTKAGANSRMAARRGETDFPVQQENRDRLLQIVAEAFTQELAKAERFQLTDETGSDVLIVRGQLLDVVSHVPPETPGRGDVYLDEIGAATLAIEIIDSESNTVLLRAVDRRAAESHGMPIPSNTATNWSEVRRLAQFWARLLRQRLDGLAEALSLSESAI